MEPAELFLDWYFDALSEEPKQAANDHDRAIRDALKLDSGADCVRRLRALVTDSPSCKLRCLELIDDQLSRIHPRGAARVGANRAPQWLVGAQAARIRNGAYAANDQHRLIARGPLTRRERDGDLEYRALFMDRFSNVRVVKTSYADEDQASYRVNHKVYPPHALHSATIASDAGEETIVFVPIAHDHQEWCLRIRQRAQQSLLSIRPVGKIRPAERLLQGLRQAPKGDIAIAPEFSMPWHHARQFGDRLGELGDHVPRVVVAGSGLSRQRDARGYRWNETLVLNEFGTTLLEQRKLHPSEVDDSRLALLGVACTTPRAVERTARGTELSVSDVPGIGRIVVFICHDIKIRPLACSLLTDYEPDWVFMPVFDRGFANGRWSHQSMFECSNNSLTRIVGCSTLAWPQTPDFGMVHGPRCAAQGIHERAVALIQCANKDFPVRCGHITWNVGDARWKASALEFADAPTASPASSLTEDGAGQSGGSAFAPTAVPPTSG